MCIYEGGPPQTWNYLLKNCVFILTCLNFSHLQSILLLMQYSYWDFFSTAQNSFWTHWFWCLLVLLLFFSPTSSTLAKCFTLRTFSSRETKKNLIGGRSGDLGGWGTGVMPFLVKNCWTLSVVWAGAIINHPTWNGQMLWRSPHTQKSSLKPNATSPNNTSWYTDTDGFPEYSPSEGSLYYKRPTLQEIILGFLAPSLYT